MPKVIEAPKRGRKPKPPEERLVGNGIHMRPAAKEDLRVLVAFHKAQSRKPDSQREFIEKWIAAEMARQRKNPKFNEFLKNKG